MSDTDLADVITRTAARGGSVLIPAFAVDRTEVLLMSLQHLLDAGQIPALPIYVDSPMALSALHAYRAAIADREPDIRSEWDPTTDPFDAAALHEATTPTQSMQLNQPSRPCIIVSASGMATGGRVLHHLRWLLPDSRNSVVLAGYQAVGTRGRDLAEGATQVKIHGEYVPVSAEVVALESYSVHADADEVVRWLGALPEAPHALYLVHGEPAASAEMARRIRAELGWSAVVPSHGEVVRVR